MGHVGLQQAIEAVRDTIELASRRGLAQARIALHPEDLGEIRIHLTQSVHGLIARIAADTPAAAQALADSHGELRQSLGSLNLSALHLDTSACNDPGMGGRHDGSPQHSTDAGYARRSANAEGESGAGDTGQMSETDSVAPTPEHSRGALVDVLA